MGKHGPDPAKDGGQRNQAVWLEGAGVSKEKANSLQARPAVGRGKPQPCRQGHISAHVLQTPPCSWCLWRIFSLTHTAAELAAAPHPAALDTSAVAKPWALVFFRILKHLLS